MREDTALSWLLKYKPWLALAEAADYLNKSPGMNVTETDLLRLALQGYLTIAARFAYPVAATLGTVRKFSFPGPAEEYINFEPSPMAGGIEGVYVLRFDQFTLRFSVNGDLESNETLGGLVFNTDVPGKVVMIGTHTLPETARWVIQSRDLLEFESKPEDFSNSSPAYLHAQLNQISVSSQWGESSAAEALETEGAANQKKDAELEDMRQQLEQERAARKTAEDKVAKLKEEIRLMLEAQRWAQEVAEQDKTEEVARRRDDWLREQSSHQPNAPATGLNFPYATKHLEAMRDAAIMHWVGHDRSMPAPYGIQKKVQNFLASRTGDNHRKIVELANAIKPEDLPKV